MSLGAPLEEHVTLILLGGGKGIADAVVVVIS